jgi:hypothetical protein
LALSAWGWGLEAVHLVQIFDHGRHRGDPGPPATNPQAEYVPVGIGVGQQEAGAVSPPGPTGPDLGDAVDDVHPFGAGKQITGVRERLPAIALRNPERPPSLFLEFLNRLAHLGGELILEVKGPDPKRPQVQAVDVHVSGLFIELSQNLDLN